MKIEITNNFPEVANALAQAKKQVPFALALALTKTAQVVKDKERTLMASTFDRPTPYTLNSLYLRTATKSRLAAEVWLKGDGSLDGGTARHYVDPTIFGGDRPLKRFEQRLVRTGQMRRTERAVPGEAAQKDAYGNMNRGQLVKILSQLHTAAVLGDYSNASSSKRSKAKRSAETFFVSQGPGSSIEGKYGDRIQHLARGVWLRKKSAFGSAVRPVLLFVDGAKYKPILKFFETADATVAGVFSTHFKLAFNQALASVKQP